MVLPGWQGKGREHEPRHGMGGIFGGRKKGECLSDIFFFLPQHN